MSENKTKKGIKRSYVWDHFQEIENKTPNAKRRGAECKYCGADYACDGKTKVKHQ